MADEMRTPTTSSESNGIKRSFFVQTLHRFVNVIRATLALFLALVAITSGVAWSANATFPLAVLQRIGFAGTGNLRGVKWAITWPPEEADSVWIGVHEQSVHLQVYHLHQGSLGRMYIRYFYDGPWGIWNSEIQVASMPRGYILRSADGTNIKYNSSLMISYELPLLGLCLISAPYPIIVVYFGPWRRWQRRRKGLCLICGYNLTGNITGICSECGHVVEHNKHKTDADSTSID